MRKTKCYCFLLCDVSGWGGDLLCLSTEIYGVTAADSQLLKRASKRISTELRRIFKASNKKKLALAFNCWEAKFFRAGI